MTLLLIKECPKYVIIKCSFRSYAGAVAGGAIAGAAVVSGLGFIASTAISTLANVAGNVAEQLISTGNVSIKQVGMVAISSLIFAGAGAIGGKIVSKLGYLSLVEYRKANVS